jgi:hypothetical protein
MNETDVIIEYSRRYELARICQYLAVPLLLISSAGLWFSRGALGGTGGKIFFIVSGVVFIASVGLGLLSIDRYRCPYCAKNLGVARKIKFCPYCGVTLQSVNGTEIAFSSARTEGRRGLIGGAGADFIPAGGGSRAAASRSLSQATFRPLATDFPDETYPKDIRLFTTSDEMELTKRYIRLIAKDETPPPDEPPAPVAVHPIGSAKAARSDASESAPRWRNKEKRKIL